MERRTSEAKEAGVGFVKIEPEEVALIRTGEHGGLGRFMVLVGDE